ncbi:hypothetical protein [Vulcanisaeta sp. JCM 14467]
MSLGQVVRHYGIRIGVVAVFLVLILLVAPSIVAHAPFLSTLIKWFVNALLLPILIFLALRLAGKALMTRSGTAARAAGNAIADLIAPILLAYLLLGNTELLVTGFIHYAKLPGIFTALFIITAGAITANYGNSYGEPVRHSITYVGAAVVLYGVAVLASIPYAPAALPFLYAAMGSAIMGAAMLAGLAPSLRHVSGDIIAVSKPVVALFFILGLAAALTQVPQLRPYSGYVMTASLVLLLIVVSLIGYRLYTAVSRTAEKISERIYEQHVRESPLAASSEDEALTNAINEFLRWGRKDELIAYTAYALAQCDVDYEDVMKVLNSLINYQPPQRTGIWPWEVKNLEQSVRVDMENRKAITAEILNAITNCPQKHPNKKQTT